MALNGRYLVQFMTKHGVAPESTVLGYCKTASDEDVDTDTKLKTLIIEVNREISKQSFKIMPIYCEVTDNKLLVWTNNKNDDISKLQMVYSPIELEYFQAIVEEIIHSEYRKITSIVCLNISSTLTAAYPRESGQNLMKEWITGGYFVRKGEYIHLGPRLILEFTTFLKSKCPHCVCHLCREVAFTGTVCANCDKIYHKRCIEKWHKTQNTCASCKKAWSPSDIFQDHANIMHTTGRVIVQNGSSDDSDDDIDEAGPSQKRLRQ